MQACFIFLLCMLMTSASKSLRKKIFHRVENVIKQSVHTSAAPRATLMHLLCTQTSCMLHILMNTHWRMNKLLINVCTMFSCSFVLVFFSAIKLIWNVERHQGEKCLDNSIIPSPVATFVLILLTYIHTYYWTGYRKFRFELHMVLHLCNFFVFHSPCSVAPQ